MPTKTLPANPSLDHLKHQAKDLIKARQEHSPEANQRIREFHPRFRTSSDAEIGAAKFTLGDAQVAIAREYGYASWAKLRSALQSPTQPESERPLQERIEDPDFRLAVNLIDAGDEGELRHHLVKHPELVRKRVHFEGVNYFRNPTLLEFCAENPIRNGRLPSNIVEVAKVILDSGGKQDKPSIDETLGLVSSGCVVRECHVQIPLIDLLCGYGADPNTAMRPALGHGEFEAVAALLQRGAKLDLPVAAATGKVEEAEALVEKSSPSDRHLALGYASQYGHLEIVRLLLDACEDPNRFNPIGGHSHSTPLHQAAFNGHLAVVRFLVERGANTQTKDIFFQATPLGWAEYGNQTEVANYLRKSPANDRPMDPIEN